MSDDDSASDSAASGGDAPSPYDVAVTRILTVELWAFVAGGVGFLALRVAAGDNPTTGAAALLLVFAFGFPPSIFALTLEAALAAWPRARARRICWFAALASLPVAMGGALTALVFLSILDLV